MVHDEELAERVRRVLGPEPEVGEQRMFGGLAFLVGGHMSVAVSHHGGLMVRTDPAEAEDLLADPHVRPVEMRGRPMRGWLRVDAGGLRTAGDLEQWVWRGVARARALPAKG